MDFIPSPIRDRLTYTSGYLQGRAFSLPTNFSEAYALVISKVTTLIALPLPFLSFLALPILGGSATTINLIFFYLTWTALVASHSALTLEIGGTLTVKLLFYLLPAYASLAFDCTLPSLAQHIKARGPSQLPSALSRRKLLHITALATLNTLLPIALQALLELTTTRLLHLRSLLKVTTTVPLPWTIARHLLLALLLRSILRYTLHRHALHGTASPLRPLHTSHQHNIAHPFALAAAYDHPLPHLLATWLPTYLPALLLRLHILTHLLYLTLTSLTDLVLYSGYTTLPSTILLPGMARRTDEHFASFAQGGGEGNFGTSGVLDWVCGTGLGGSGEGVVADLRREAEKREVRERAEGAVEGAVGGVLLEDDGKGGEGDGGESDGSVYAEEGDGRGDKGAEREGGAPRRSGRRKGLKG